MSSQSSEQWKYILGALTFVAVSVMGIYTIIKQAKGNKPNKPSKPKQNEEISESQDIEDKMNKDEEEQKEDIEGKMNKDEEEQKEESWTTREFKYESDFDTNGLVYNLGSEYGAMDWINPATTNKLRLSCSGIKDDSQPLSSIVGREAVRCVLAHNADSWFIVDFGEELKICPTNYTLRHYSSWNEEALRCWNLEGSIDGNVWILLKNHEQDQSLNCKGKSVTWSLNTSYYFNKFRILMTGKNDNDHNYLCCSGFEIYGIVKRGNDCKNLADPLTQKTVVFGFCHKYIESMDIKTDLIELIFNYYYFSLSILKSQFIFNKNKLNYQVGIEFIDNKYWFGIEFVDNKHVILEKTSIVMIDYMISKEITNNKNNNIFEWEIKINKLGKPSYIGFVDADIFPGCPKELPVFGGVNGFNDYVFDDENKKYDFAMSIMADKTWFCRYSKYHHTDKEIELHISSYKLNRTVATFKNGDVFKLRINFKTKICDLYVNNTLFVEKLFVNIPNRIIPGISGTGDFQIKFNQIK